jgi:hypothetical protein
VCVVGVTEQVCQVCVCVWWVLQSRCVRCVCVMRVTEQVCQVCVYGGCYRAGVPGVCVVHVTEQVCQVCVCDVCYRAGAPGAEPGQQDTGAGAGVVPAAQSACYGPRLQLRHVSRGRTRNCHLHCRVLCWSNQTMRTSF